MKGWKILVVDSGSIVELVELSHHHTVVHIRRLCELLYLGIVEVLLGTIRRRIGEDHDDRLVRDVVARNM